MARVIFDGDCGFCRRCAAWAKRRTDAAFVPWQALDDGATRSAATRSVLWVDHRVLDRSAACIRVLWSMHLGWRIVGAVLWLVPKPIRDRGYDAVAKRWGPL